jgi:hypothetical protein
VKPCSRPRRRVCGDMSPRSFGRLSRVSRARRPPSGSARRTAHVVRPPPLSARPNGPSIMACRQRARSTRDNLPGTARREPRSDMMGRRGWRQTGPPPRARKEHGGVDWRQDPRLPIDHGGNHQVVPVKPATTGRRNAAGATGAPIGALNWRRDALVWPQKRHIYREPVPFPPKGGP